MLNFNISHWDLIKFPYFVDTSKKGDMGWKKRRRYGDIMDISIVYPKFNISLVKYSVLEASFKKVKIWVIVWLWSKHKLLCTLYFSFVTHGWCDQTSSIYCTIIGKLHIMIQLLMNHYIIRELLSGNFWAKFWPKNRFVVVICFYFKRKQPYFGGNVLGKKFTTLGHKF
jgi:hypothetical protein